MAVYDARVQQRHLRRLCARRQRGSVVLAAQGVGNETDLMVHQYDGVGWYRKSLTVGPVPKGGSVWLWIGGAPGGVMRSANVWANGVHCGRHVGYLAPLEIELTPAINSAGGALVLAVAVDSRWNRTEDPLWGGGSMWN